MDSILRSALAARLGLRVGAVRRLGLLGLALLAAGFGGSTAVSAQEGVAAKAPAGKAAPASKAAAAKTAAPKADAAAGGPEEDLLMAQTILGELGLYEGEPDGKPNAATEKALREFQGEAGLEVSGKLDQFTTDALLEVMESIEEDEELGGGLFADEGEGEEAEGEEDAEGPPPQCRGYNLETESPVAGSCTEGKFEGVDEETGSAVTGKCAAGGDMDGQDATTKQRVAGTCG
jgi:peptidoglycan hydrolase-like protein with peptidoglycan-binding domain